jgi:hypothetical protein
MAEQGAMMSLRETSTVLRKELQIISRIGRLPFSELQICPLCVVRDFNLKNGPDVTNCSLCLKNNKNEQ